MRSVRNCVSLRAQMSTCFSNQQTKPKVVSQATIAGAFANEKSKPWIEIIEAVTFWLAKNMMPMQMEKEVFRYHISRRK